MKVWSKSSVRESHADAHGWAELTSTDTLESKRKVAPPLLR